ncbi:type II secretion system protein XpsH [Luteimonas sp. A611]
MRWPSSAAGGADATVLRRPATPSAARPARRVQRGMTLLEILLVMALIAATGLLAAGILTGGFDRMELRSSARELAAQLRFTRTRAIATGTTQQFTIDPAARAWQGADGHGGEIPESLDVQFTGAREVQPGEGVGAIVFFSDGASTGGRVQLRMRDAAWNIDVAWLTGEVTLRRREVGR